MRRCIIHIGMHKTGSTSIQHSLHGFRDNRFLYARLGDVPNHSLAMYSLFAPHPERHHLHRAERPDDSAVSKYISEMRTALERAVAAAGHRTLLISGEDICVLPAEGLVRLRDYFQSRFDDITIVGYVRPPGGFMTSGFQQRVKSGSVKRFDLEREYRNYEKSFSRFDEIFGRENVQLWKYDPGKFPGGCAVQDFCSRLTIPIRSKRIVKLNESLPRQVIVLLYTYRKLGHKFGFDVMRAPEGQKLATLLATVGNDRFRFSPGPIKLVLKKNRPDIKWMEARLGQSLREELGIHQPGDVRREVDLLTPDPVAVSKLLALLGKSAPKGVQGTTPDEVALLVHAFREKYAKRANRYFGLFS